MLSRCGRNGLVYLLIWLLVFSPSIFTPRLVFANFEDQTDSRLPPLSKTTYNFAIADVDGRHGPDLLIANREQVVLLLNDGTGTFHDATAQLPVVEARSLGVALGDIDNNGSMDAILANAAGSNLLLINDGTGNFSDESAARIPSNVQVSTDVVFAHLNNDSALDIVVANRGSSNRIWLNDGSGHFTDATEGPLATDSDATQALAVVDVNDDGALDIFVANDGGQNRLYLNNGLAVFTDVTATALPPKIDETLDVAFGDVDNDGDADLMLANGVEGLSLLINDDGIFTPAPADALPALTDYTIGVQVGDVNEDGFVDAVLANAAQNRVLLGDGAGTFSDVTSNEIPANEGRSFAVSLFDADADLDLDLVEATPQAENRLFVNQVPFPRIRIAVSPEDYIEVGTPVTITVTVFDEDGIASTSLTVNGTPVTLVDGIGTVVPLTAGPHHAVVTAEDVLGNVGTRSLSFNVEPPDLTGPVVTLGIDPTSVLVGESVTITATATDAASGVAGISATVNGSPVALDTSGSAVFVTSATGLHSVDITATDLSGNLGTATGTFTVLPDNELPVVSLVASPDPVDLVEPIFINVSATDNVNVSSLTLAVSGPGITGEQSLDINADGQASFTPYVPGTYTLTARALDPSGNEGIATLDFDAVGVPDTTLPVVTLTIDRAAVALGGDVTINVAATDDILVSSISLTINGTPVTLDDAGMVVFTPPVLGDYTAVARALDPTGNEGTASVTFQAVDPASDTEHPVVAFTSPAEGGELSAAADLLGTVTDLTLTQYTLAIAPTGTGNYTTFATGFTPVTDGLLGTLDTTTLQNGLYDIRLQASDVNGLSSSTTRTFSVTGAFKASIFTTTVTDLRMPVSGIDITINRTYDSRTRAHSGDFGFGWTIEVIQNGTYTNNRPPGDGWFIASGGGFLNPPCSISNETQFHRTEVRFSDTEFYQFALQVNMFGFGSVISGGCAGNAEFVQVGGVPGAQLDIIGSADVFWQSGGNELTYDLGDIRFGDVWVPEDVRLTTLDGRVFDLNLNDGLERIGDTNGNSIFINSNGVVHSSGKSISFTRDGQGRITAITDPLGHSILYGYDDNGDLVTVTDRNGNVTTQTYFDGHFLDEIQDPLGNARVRNEYDASGRLIAQIDAEGNRTEFDADADAGTLSVTDRNGTVSTFAYDDDGNLTDASTGSAEKQFTYDDAGNKITETDERGNTKTFTYNANRQPTSETDALGNTTTYDYDGSGRPTLLTDPSGNELAFAYDAKGNVTEMRDAGATLLQGFTYDTSGNPTQVTLQQGSVAMTYDASGNRLTQTGPGSLQLTFTYDALGRVLTETAVRAVDGSPINETKSYEYDANGNVTAVIDALGKRTDYTYNANGQRTTRTDTVGRVTTFIYDDRNLLQRTNYPDSTFELFGYDLDGRKTAETDRAGRTTFFEYDERDNVTRILYPDGSDMRMEYDATNNMTRLTDARGNSTAFTYDALNRRLSQTDALGNVTTFTYLANNTKPATKTDPVGNTTTFTYDGRMFGIEMPTVSTFADGTTRVQTRGASGLVTSVTNELGNTTTYAYDDNNRLIRVIDAVGGSTTYTYDEAGNRISETDAEGRTTTFEYDANGNQRRRTLPLGMSETRTYDDVGNLTSKTDFNGNTTTFEYDTMNRLTRKVLPGGGEVTYTYTPTGEIATVTDARGVTTYTYDARDRVTSIVQPNGETLSYAYDAVGNRTAVTTADGTTTYTYDALNRVATVTDPDGNLTSYVYDAAGNLINTSYQNNTEANYDYDARHRVTQVQHTGSGGTLVLAQFDYTLDDAGRRIEQTDLGGSVKTYTYDDIDRLLSETVDGVTTTYTYDGAGNRLTATTGSTVVTNTYDDNNRLLTSGPLTFTYDDNGNTLNIADGVSSIQFQYDPENRLVRHIAPDGSTTDFIYDDDGHRIRRTVNGVVTEFVVDPQDISGLSQVLLERDGLGNLLARYIYGHDLISLSQGGGTSFFHPDALGSTRLLTDEIGDVTDDYDYDAFGLLVDSVGATPNTYLFAGEQYDPDLDLYFLRARYLDPFTGRFLTADPFPPDIRNPLTLNRYLYANANPVNVIDPSGEFGLVSISISIAITGILASIAVYNYIYKPAKELYDKLDKLMNEIPKLELNKDAKKDELGITPDTVKDAIDEKDIAKVVNLGNGAVHQAYDVVYALVTSAGKWVTAIHARNSAEWMKYLPQKDMIPAKYLDCGFNSFVQAEYGFQLVSGAAVKKIPKLGTAVNVIGTYLSYFTFLALIVETAGELGSGVVPPQPAGGSCP